MSYSADFQTERARLLSRRWFLRDCGVGLAGVALTQMLAREARAAAPPTKPLAPRTPPFAPQAKRVNYLFQAFVFVGKAVFMNDNTQSFAVQNKLLNFIIT